MQGVGDDATGPIQGLYVWNMCEDNTDEELTNINMGNPMAYILKDFSYVSDMEQLNVERPAGTGCFVPYSTV